MDVRGDEELNNTSAHTPNADSVRPPWTCPKCCANNGERYLYPPGPLVYCLRCGRAMNAKEQIAAALAWLSLNQETAAVLASVRSANDPEETAAELRRLREAIEHKAPRQRVREAAEGSELLSLRQVDAVLGKRRGTAAALIESGKLVPARVGSRLSVSRTELDRFLATPGELTTPSSRRPRRKRPATAIGAQRAAAIRALRVVRR